ncbi:MAG: phosphotransferase enzyme family protein [Gammaproteobacteria bacterium]
MSGRFEDLDEAAQRRHLEDVAARALPAWGLPETTPLTLLNISENATYRVEPPAPRPPVILRVHRTGYHTLDAVRTELAWMKALKDEAGIETPQAIAAADGALIRQVETPALGETRMVVMFALIEGDTPDENDLAPTFRRLGGLAARMHAHARAWPRPPYFERLHWDQDAILGPRPNWGRWQDGMGLDEAARALLTEAESVIGRRLAAYGSGPERFGLIHADLHIFNLLEVGGETRVIDFDDSGLGWFMYDFATAVSFESDPATLESLAAVWVDGYREEAPLAEADVAELPTFILLRRLAIIAWIGSHSDTDLARDLGLAFTHDTLPLARRYIARFGPGG